MADVKPYSFNKNTIEELSKEWFAQGKEVVYILEDSKSKELYIGETKNIIRRLKEHLKNQDKQKLTKVYIIIDDFIDKSAGWEIETQLVHYFTT